MENLPSKIDVVKKNAPPYSNSISNCLEPNIDINFFLNSLNLTWAKTIEHIETITTTLEFMLVQMNFLGRIDKLPLTKNAFAFHYLYAPDSGDNFQTKSREHPPFNYR